MCPIGGWVPNAVHRSKANQCSPVLETHHIPLKHTGWTIPMLVRAISLEKSVPETLLFGAPSFQLSLRRRLPSLLPAPVNASYKRETSRCHTLKVRESQRGRRRTVFFRSSRSSIRASSKLFTMCLLVRLIRNTAERGRRDGLRFSGITRKQWGDLLARDSMCNDDVLGLAC
jgi:hypothetical protein